MKRMFTKIGLAILILATISCSKDESEDSRDLPIIDTNSDARVGQTISIKFTDSIPGLVTEWSISPSAGATIARRFSWNGSNNITFHAAGTYRITGKFKKVLCDSLTASNPGMDTCLNAGTVNSISARDIVVK